MTAKKKKSFYGFSSSSLVLCSFLLPLSLSVSHAASCTPVADLVIKNKSDLQSVSVTRHFGAEDPDNIPATVLCVDDEVSIENKKGLSVIIRYRSNPPGELPLTGGSGTSDRLVLPILQTSNVRENAWHALQTWWFNRDSGTRMASLVTRVPTSITSALSRGEDDTQPYYVVPDIDEINFVWQGGQAPWTIVITDAQGKQRVGQKTDLPEASFNLAANVGEYFTLNVQSADGLRLVKKIVFEPILLSDTSLPVDSWSRLFPLMVDKDKNWRLYLWNVIRRMPDSASKNIVIEHLRDDDI